jgi:hypothetical protein
VGRNNNAIHNLIRFHQQKILSLPDKSMIKIRYMNITKSYLEKIKRHLLLNTKTSNFVMIHKIKIYILPNLLQKVLVPGNLEDSLKSLH